jgi:histidinol phosphatase-like enzyme (inositol monophosphatase family)
MEKAIDNRYSIGMNQPTDPPSPASPETLARLELARAIALEAGRLTIEYFRRDDLAVEQKADATPVTQADRRAEELLRERIAAAYPADAILGEEFGEQPGDSGYQWVLDPIDGTKSFITGVPLYTTLVGILLDGRPVAGVIRAPATDETLWAALGHGAWYSLGERPAAAARVSARDRLSDATVLTSEIESFAQRAEGDMRPAFQRLQSAARLSRTWGDAYGYLLVATGRADVMIDPLMNLWDAAPLLPILREAGGTYTDWRGRAEIDAGEGLGTNGHLLAEVLSYLRRL